MAFRLIRYSAALVLLVYGFAKINGSQFTVLDSELDKPLGRVSGFWLTWHYFSFSPFYGTLLAIVQIIGAVLLMFRRTTPLAALTMIPMLANIVLIDIFYGVDPGAAIVAMILLAAMVVLLAPQRRELLALVWPVHEPGTDSFFLGAARWCIRFALLVVAFLFTYWVANFNNRAPTALDGVWDVVQIDSEKPDGRLPETIFFERNRAFMTVFKSNDGVYKTHHFEVDPSLGRIQIWETWLRKGKQIFEGSYTLGNPKLRLEGTWQGVGRRVLWLRSRSFASNFFSSRSPFPHSESYAFRDRPAQTSSQ